MTTDIPPHDAHLLPRLHRPEPLAPRGVVELPPETAHYLLHVLRRNDGALIRLFNARDGEWKATLRVEGTGKRTRVTATVQEPWRRPEPEGDVWLCCAPIKRTHFDDMIAKATELGVTAIHPVLTGRTQVRSLHLERCQAIMTEAAEQSERLSVPAIHEPVPLPSLLRAWPAGRLLLACAEFGEARSVPEALLPSRPGGPAAILTGPEGGFLPEEMEEINRVNNRISLRLGPRILRADTAALAALTCWQALRGHWL